MQSCTYLGFYVDRKAIYPDKSKIQLRSYLGAINCYGKFILEMQKLRDNSSFKQTISLY